MLITKDFRVDRCFWAGVVWRMSSVEMDGWMGKSVDDKVAKQQIDVGLGS